VARYKGLSKEQKEEVLRFNKEHLAVEIFDEQEALREAEQAVMDCNWGTEVTLELPSHSTRSGNPETLNLGLVNDFYTN
jgi:hypothetical protein